MHPLQKRVARHALGLRTRPRQSFRNFYAAFVGSADHALWDDMCALGYATVYIPKNGNTLHHFKLTRAGAEAALNPGDSLCPEDFPDV